MMKSKGFYIPLLYCAYSAGDRWDCDNKTPSLVNRIHNNVSEKFGFRTCVKNAIAVQCQNNHRSDKQKYKLLTSCVFFRHGARTPLSHLPENVPEVNYDVNKFRQIPQHTNVPIVIKSLDDKPRPHARLDERYKQVQFKGGMYAGMLTTVGREQAYNLGQRIRDRYVSKDFISKTYNDAEVSIRSTNVDRCIESLQCVLGGIYGAQSFKEPVVIPVANFSAEILFPNTKFCDTLRKLEQKTPDYLWEQDGYRFTAHYIKYFLNVRDFNKYFPLMNWRDHDIARTTHGLEVPLWLEAIRDHVHMWATKSIETYTCGVPQDRLLVLQLSSGPMLNLIVTAFDEAMNRAPGYKKLSLYSCHDSSLVPLLNGLGIFDHKWPPYSADVTIELYMNEKRRYFVKMSYCEKDIELPGYESPMIPYDKFQEMIAAYVVTPPQYNQMCHDMDLAMRHAKYWEAAIKSHEQEDMRYGEDEQEDFPPNM